MDYLDDARFAKARAESAAKVKHHGRRRAMMELTRRGIGRDVADAALGAVYTKDSSLAVATDLAEKQAPRLRRLDPAVARRRLVGMLQRRGFEYDAIKPVVDRVLGSPLTTDAAAGTTAAMNRIDAPPKLPARPADGNKGTFGRVLVVGGSAGMIGAPALAGRAALRWGPAWSRWPCPRSSSAPSSRSPPS